jgi:hypothetical protein
MLYVDTIQSIRYVLLQIKDADNKRYGPPIILSCMCDFHGYIIYSNRVDISLDTIPTSCL